MHFAGAQITGDSIQRPLVTDNELIVDATPEPDESGWMPTRSNARCSSLYLPPPPPFTASAEGTGLWGIDLILFWHSRYRGMCPCVPGPLLPTPGCQLQFPVIGFPSGTTSFPSLHRILCPKREEMLVFDLESGRFNTFYSAFSCNSAKI